MSRVSELTGALHDGDVLGDGKTRPAKSTRVGAMNISEDGIATSGFCEDVCNALKQRADKAELVEALKKAREFINCCPRHVLSDNVLAVLDAALKKAGE